MNANAPLPVSLLLSLIDDKQIKVPTTQISKNLSTCSGGQSPVVRLCFPVIMPLICKALVVVALMAVSKRRIHFMLNGRRMIYALYGTGLWCVQFHGVLSPPCALFAGLFLFPRVYRNDLNHLHRSAKRYRLEVLNHHRFKKTFKASVTGKQTFKIARFKSLFTGYRSFKSFAPRQYTYCWSFERK